MKARSGQQPDRKDEAVLDKTVLNALGLGLHQAFEYLFHSAPSFDEFEKWIISTAGMPSERSKSRLLSLFDLQPTEPSIAQWFEHIAKLPPVLSSQAIQQWQGEGYVVLENAVPKEALNAAKQTIVEHINVSLEEPDSWYGQSQNIGIMVELIQHPSFEIIRQSERIHKAFSQLWETADLWVSADRCGFHPPQTPNCPFPGPDLHWVIDFSEPLQSGTQGILYLTDTPAEQGALTLVPGFHKRLAKWLESSPPNTDPQKQDLHPLGSKPVAGKAGDLVIWNQLLPMEAAQIWGSNLA